MMLLAMMGASWGNMIESDLKTIGSWFTGLPAYLVQFPFGFYFKLPHIGGRSLKGNICMKIVDIATSKSQPFLTIRHSTEGKIYVNMH